MRDVFCDFFVMIILRFSAVFKLLQFIEGHIVFEAPIITESLYAVDIETHRQSYRSIWKVLLICVKITYQRFLKINS